MNIMTWLAIGSPTLLPLITELKAETISYNSQRMMRQLDYDQSAVQVTGEIGYSDSVNVES